jgi:hypothetical protein
MKRNKGYFFGLWVVIGFFVWMTGASAAEAQADAQQGTALAAATPSSPSPATGTLEVNVSIPGATLHLNGELMGSAAGFRHVLHPGDHEIEISAPGYQAVTLKVHVSAGQTLRLRPLLVHISTPGDRKQAGQGSSPSSSIQPPSLREPTPSPFETGEQALRPAPNGLGVYQGLGTRGDGSRPSPTARGPARPVDARAPHPPATVRPPAAPEPASPPVARAEEVDAALKKLISANVAFNTPDHMKVTKSQMIEAKLAVDMPSDVLITQLTKAGKKEVHSLSVADRMSATLDGGSAFEISPSGPQQQFISREQVTTWTWKVTPKQAGTQLLNLFFDVALTVDGKEGIRRVRSYTREIEVEVAPAGLREWLEWLKKTFEDFAWLWATILVPAGLWIWNRISKKRRPTKNKALRSPQSPHFAELSERTPAAFPRRSLPMAPAAPKSGVAAVVTAFRPRSRHDEDLLAELGEVTPANRERRLV